MTRCSLLHSANTPALHFHVMFAQFNVASAEQKALSPFYCHLSLPQP
jgi:hypothetical protein